MPTLVSIFSLSSSSSKSEKQRGKGKGGHEREGDTDGSEDEEDNEETEACGEEEIDKGAPEAKQVEDTGATEARVRDEEDKEEEDDTGATAALCEDRGMVREGLVVGCVEGMVVG